MTQEQKIIEYLELHGPQTGRDLATAFAVKSVSKALKRAIKRGEVVTTLVSREGCRRDLNLYAAGSDAKDTPCGHTVKAVQGMAPPIPQGFNPANPFNLGRHNAT